MSIIDLSYDTVTVDAPLGVIMIWSGATTLIPTGWKLCDGTNGTPDLRDRFIVGAGSGYSVSSTGGTANKTVSHSHYASNLFANAAGSHTHTWSPTTNTVTHSHTASTTSGSASNSSSFAQGTSTTFSAGTSSHTHSFSATLTDPGHSHTGTGTSSSVGDHYHLLSGDIYNSFTDTSYASYSNLPPYYALAFIMKV